MTPRGPSGRAQLAAVAQMLLRATWNSIRRRQGAGAMVVLPLLVTFLAIELARFGGRSAAGITRVLAVVSIERGVHYGAFWVLVLALALTALKFARVVPGRGAPKLFETVFVRGLPLRPRARVAGELLAAFGASSGVVAFVMVPTLWGLARHAHAPLHAALSTGLVALAVNLAASATAVALWEGAARNLAGRARDGVRVLAAVAGVGLMGMFTAVGPLGAGLARTLRTGMTVPGWSAWLPTRPAVRWMLAGADGATVFRAVLSCAVPVALSLAVFAWRARVPADLSLDAPWTPLRAPRWEPALTAPRAELRAMLRQSPYLVLAAPAFVGFFALLAKGSRSATGADLPLVVLTGLIAWAIVVMGTALTGAASRRWRRVLWLLPSFGRSHREALRAVASANLAMVLPLALSPLVVLLRAERAAWWFYPRMMLGLAAALAVGQWAQAAALMLLIDPAPDRLTGLSVGALFGVLAAALPTAALAGLLSATALGPWSIALGLWAALAWTLERAATERLRWIRDPDGDPMVDARAWPAMRTFGTALLAQVVAVELCGPVLHVSLAATLVMAYAAFAALVLPPAIRRWRAAAPEARWSPLRAVLTGALVGALNFALTVAAMRAWRSLGLGASGPASPVAGALSQTSGALRIGLAVTAALVAPVSEELFFRGWLQQALKVDLGPSRARWAWVLTAMVFAGLHAGEPLAPVLLGGLCAGALLERSGRLAAPMAFHLVNNGLAVAVALSAR